MKDLNEILNSHLKIKIMKFFAENPASVESVRGISTWINKDKNEVKKALSELAAEGVIKKYVGATTTGYSFIANRKLCKKIINFIKEHSEKI